MKIKTIHQHILDAPTIMDAQGEMQYFEQLMSLNLPEVLTDWKMFIEILHRLSESHTQVFFEVTPINKGRFIEFADWLVKIANDLSDSETRMGLISLADTFRIDPAVSMAAYKKKDK